MSENDTLSDHFVETNEMMNALQDRISEMDTAIRTVVERAHMRCTEMEEEPSKRMTGLRCRQCPVRIVHELIAFVPEVGEGKA